MDLPEKKRIVSNCMNHGFLVSPSFFDDKPVVEDINFKFYGLNGKELSVLNDDVLKLLGSEITDVNWKEFERLRVFLEKKGNRKPYDALINFAKKNSLIKDTEDESVKIKFSYEKEILKKSINNFIVYFNNRFKEIESILRVRQELNSLTSISRVKSKRERENVSLIGLVVEKTTTPNENIMLKIEDPTGTINVLVSKNNPELYEIGKDIVNDEVVGINGVGAGNIVFSNGIVFPDIPLNREIKKSPEESYAVFLSDIHVGSNNFLADKFDIFLDWINGNVNMEKNKDIVDKIKYVFIAGDLVDGVGIYPGQEEELDILDIYDQYKKCAELLSRIPKHIQIIVCPGNHDATRLSEPQPPIFKDFTKPLTDLPNVRMVSNPSYLNIGSTSDFPGFDVLMYHGYSFDYFVANVDSIRNNGGYDRAELIMKFLLQRRHLAPSHKSTLYVPDMESDCLVIKEVPDFFVSGHIHKVAISSYRGVDLICGSCWQSVTKFQEKMGHHPEPARVPIVNLKTREKKILRF